MVKATIYGKDEIIVVNGKSTLGKYKFDGEKLIGVAGRTISFTSSDKVEAIAKAISEYVPDSYVTKFGGEMTKEDRMLGGWEFSGVVNDAHGEYTKRTKGTGGIEVILKD